MRHLRWKVAFALAAVALMLMMGRAPAQMNGPRKISRLDPGDKAIPFSVVDIADHKRSLSDYKGKILLLDFWATWCPPCRAEMPNLARLSKQYKGQGFEILGISQDQDFRQMLGFAQYVGMRWPQIFDAGTGFQISQKYGVTALPASYLIDGTTGKVIAKDLRGSGLVNRLAEEFAKRKKKS